MNFNSLNFIFLFLPIFLIVYYCAPGRYRNLVLCLGSLAFYCIGTWRQPWCIVLLVALTCLTWLAGMALEKWGRNRGFLTICLVALFGSLAVFKYAGLFGSSLIFPLGMSFYVFQMAAYLLDVYWRRIPVETALLPFSTGILMFPKLLSGPLTRAEELQPQVRQRRYSLEGFDQGLRDFLVGLGMKVLLADRVGGIWSQVKTIGFESISTPLAWMGLVAFSLQLYLDFCGYSWMAIGLGRMLGFHLPRNFDHPYAARSMSEFWRRWHITLGLWFRNYVYIPLGGNRKGLSRTVFNLFVVWLLTGMWHGAGWSFLLWGLFLFFLIANEKLWLGKILKRRPVLSRVYMLFAILFSWMLFAIPDLGQIGVYLSRLFPFFGGGVAVSAGDFFRLGKQFGVFLILGLVVSFPGPERLWNRIRTSVLGTILLFLLFWAVVYCLSVATNDPFMYFSF